MHIRRALIPGTFDPVTLGHLSVIRTASLLFDEVTVCILVNPEKTCMFDEQTRVEALEIALRELSNVKIDVSHHMTADYAGSPGAVEHQVQFQLLVGMEREVEATFFAREDHETIVVGQRRIFAKNLHRSLFYKVLCITRQLAVNKIIKKIRQNKIIPRHAAL